jgi:hypothetical protein
MQWVGTRSNKGRKKRAGGILATKGTFENKGFLRELDFHTIMIRRHYKQSSGVSMCRTSGLLIMTTNHNRLKYN